MENQIYLTPSQVEELRELGVQFEDSKMVWKISGNHQNIEIRNSIGDWASNVGTVKWETIYAPSLQEVLDKLPKIIEVFCDEDCSDLYYLTLSHFCSDYWSVYYLKNSHKIEHLANYSNANPLLAAYELLLWVATHHPESLTKNE